MALETAFQELDLQFQKLLEALLGLRVTVVEDKPLRDDVMLSDLLGDACEDLLGWCTEARAAAREGARALAGQQDLHCARRQLTICQDRYNRITHKFSLDLVAYERIAEINRLGRERGGEWRTWASSVKTSLDACQQPLYDVNQALFHCWQEIADRVSTTSISVQATSIGQQVKVSENAELVKEGIT